jgi:hypothetical protein
MSLDRLINILVTVTLIEMMALIGLRMMLRRILILLGETPSSLSATHYALRLARNAEAKTAGLPALPIPPIGRCQLWVTSKPHAALRPRPLHPSKRTCASLPWHVGLVPIVLQKSKITR